MSNSIVHPMTLRSTTFRDVSSPTMRRLKKKNKEMRDKFPVENLNADVPIPTTIEAPSKLDDNYSYIPVWLNNISHEYLYDSLAIIEKNISITCEAIIKHRICKGILTGCEVLSEISDELVENRVF